MNESERGHDLSLQRQSKLVKASSLDVFRSDLMIQSHISGAAL